MDMIKMRSLTVFANPRLQSGRPDGTVLTGESFETDEQHAKELELNGLAERVVAETTEADRLKAEAAAQAEADRVKAEADRLKAEAEAEAAKGRKATKPA